MFSRVLVFLSVIIYVTGFLSDNVFNLPAVTHHTVIAGDKYLQVLEGKKRSRYSRSWKQKFLENAPPPNVVKKRSVQPKSPRLPVSDTGVFQLEMPTMNFTCIGGYEDVKEELSQTVDFLKNPGNYTVYNVRVPRGVILHGLPGTGKTLLAKCFAGEAGLPFIATSGSIFQEKYVGTGAARIRELFNFARSQAPCIIFVDEVESVGRQRSSNGEVSQAERDQTLNQLLVELDGFATTDNIFFLGATNRIDIVDKALCRAGRIDKLISVGLPGKETREKIIAIHAERKPINVSIEMLVDMTHGLTGADIESVLNDAVLRAIRKNEIPVNVSVIEEIIEKRIIGQGVEGPVITESMLWRISVHEMGHALMSFGTEHHGKVRKVTTKRPSGTTLGYTVFEQTSAMSLATKEYLEERICVLLAGRVSEEIIFGQNGASIGAVQDIALAKTLAEEMVLKFGFGNKLIHASFSDNSRSEIDTAIEFIVEIALKRTRLFLEKNGKLLLSLSQLLLREKSLDYNQIVHFLENGNIK